jgi:hypothetical protein
MPLFPPIIPGTLPPVTKQNGSDPVYRLTIPYEISRGVNPSLIKGYKIIIKGIPSNEIYYQGNLLNYENINNQLIGYVSPSAKELSIGSYYKLQMAF